MRVWGCYQDGSAPSVLSESVMKWVVPPPSFTSSVSHCSVDGRGIRTTQQLRLSCFMLSASRERLGRTPASTVAEGCPACAQGPRERLGRTPASTSGWRAPCLPSAPWGTSGQDPSLDQWLEGALPALSALGNVWAGPQTRQWLEGALPVLSALGSIWAGPQPRQWLKGALPALSTLGSVWAGPQTRQWLKAPCLPSAPWGSCSSASSSDGCALCFRPGLPASRP